MARFVDEWNASFSIEAAVERVQEAKQCKVDLSRCGFVCNMGVYTSLGSQFPQQFPFFISPGKLSKFYQDQENRRKVASGSSRLVTVLPISLIPCIVYTINTL